MLSQLAQWCLCIRQDGIPATLSDLTSYFGHLHEVKTSGSTTIQMYHTALFVEHVLGGLFKSVGQSAVVKGFIAAARMNVKHRCKRRPLETVEVLVLESIVLCEEEAVVRRFNAGSLLFALQMVKDVGSLESGLYPLMCKTALS
eukprot:4293717-Amphidinium_carterae.5